MPHADAAKLPPLLPRPRRARRRPGSFALRPGLPVVLAAGATEADFAAARGLRDEILRTCGVRLAVEIHARATDLGPRVELLHEGGTEEAYRLEVSRDCIRAVGSGPAGLRHAAATLAQLAGRGGRVPCCVVEDAPDYPLRGVMLDVSRGKVPTPEALRALVDVLARLKLNALMLYVEHTFRFRRHPAIGAGAGSLDAETLRDLDAYAALRGVELIPSLQSLGHMDHVLELAPYRHLAETDRGWTISPADEGSYALLADLYDEFLPNFRSERFNANCDEPFDLARGRSAARERELGPGGVYVEHLRRVRELAAGHGRRTLVWADVVHTHPDQIPALPRDLLLLDWWYEADCDYERVRRFSEHDLEFWVCPGTSTWNCLFPRVENSIENVRRWADAGRRHGATGLLVTDWGDFGHYNLQGNSWLGYAWAAQQAWSGDAPARDFDRAFGRLFFGDASGATARAYRELGGVHDAGIPLWNGSALQFLYFDDLDRGFFVEGASAPRARRSLRRLERARERLLAVRDRFGSDELTFEELRLAADASCLAARKALAGAPYVAWRRGRALPTRERRRLARELSRLADEQTALGRRLRALWLRRARPEGFELTRRRLLRSVRSMRRAARGLARGRPPAPPPPHPGFDPRTVLSEVWRSAAG